MKLTIFTANCAGNALNPYYPNRVEAMDEDSFKAAVSLDHVAAEFKGAYRSNTNFIQADHISMDVDNELSDEPEDWITPFLGKAALSIFMSLAKSPLGLSSSIKLRVI
jgi:putative DNA primase/helicase